MELKEIKDKWLKELRSGKHNQVQGTLCGTTIDGEVGYCCLGVLHKVVLGRKVRQEKYLAEGEGKKSHYSGLFKVVPYKVAQSGIDMNDDNNNFDEIADMIEKDWKVE